MQNKIYLIYSLFILLCLVIVIFAIWPIFSNLKHNSWQIVSIKNDKFSNEQQISVLKGFLENEKKYEDSFEKVQSFLIDSKNPVLLIEFIEKLAKESGIKINISITSSSFKTSADKWNSIILQINSWGSFSGQMNFLNKIENMPYLSFVQSMKLYKDQSLGLGQNNIKADYSVKIFVK